MRWRFPLYARILLWFFLNLILLAALFFGLLRAQLHSGFDWLLAAGAGQRIQAVSDLIVVDLADRPRTEWSEVLKRFNDAYQLQFLLFDNRDGSQLAGDATPLPAAVRAYLPAHRAPLPQPGMPDDLGGGPRPRDRPDRPPPRPSPLSNESPKYLVRASHPTRYWVLTRVALRGPAFARPLPATLAVVSTTLSAGGLFFDFKPWLALGVGGVLFSVLLWLPLVRSLTCSIGQMTEATRHIAEGRFDGRVDEQRRDELGSLGQSINRMAQRLAGFVVGQKRFLGDIAHELCSPIARIQLALGILEQRADEKSLPYLEDLREEVQHMSSLVNELLSFSKASLGVTTALLGPIRVRGVAEEAIRRESAEGVEVRLEISDELTVHAEAELLARSLGNLLRNAIRYAGQAGPITVSARQENQTVLLTVADCGPGVPDSELARIFDPFYRLDASRAAATGGVGLGLSIVKTCIEACHGTVSCRNRSPSGLEATIRLPAAAQGQPSETAGGSALA